MHVQYKNNQNELEKHDFFFKTNCPMTAAPQTCRVLKRSSRA